MGRNVESYELMKHFQHDQAEKMMYLWWSRIRWYLLLVVFGIGILRVNQIQQTLPIMIFILAFIGLSILNIMFHLQIIKTSNLIGALQIVLDLLFATFVVHLTGGVDSPFIWIYLVGVITAGLFVEKAGGFIAALIGSACLLILILMYNYELLLNVDGQDFRLDIHSQSIFIISYTGLFTGVAFVSSYISDLVKKLSGSVLNIKESYNRLERRMLDNKEETRKMKQEVKQYEQLLQSLRDISSLDHDINNHLTVISLSLRRVSKAANDYGDEKLQKSAEQMNNALDKIAELLKNFHEFKQLDAVQNELKKDQG
jgi:hypothetical protein